MKRAHVQVVSLLSLGLALVVAACSDTPSAPAPFDPHAAPVFTAAAGATLSQEIDALIAAAFPTGLETASSVRWGNVKRDLAAGRPADARAKLLELAAFIEQQTPKIESALPGGETQQHAAARLTYYMSLFVYGGAAAQTAPPPPVGGDVAFGIVQPAETTTVVTPLKLAGVNFDEGSVSEPTVVVVTQDSRPFPEECSGPLATKLCQYPLFYKFEAFPHKKLLKPARFAVCMVTVGGRQPLDRPGEDEVHERLRLAHDKPAAESLYTEGSTIRDQNGESIEILPKVTEPVDHFTDCNERTYSAAAAAPRGWLGRGGQRLLGALGSLGSLVGRALTPQPLYAYDQGPEHYSRFFSNFNAVDPESQPDLSVGRLQLNTEQPMPGEEVSLNYIVVNKSRKNGGEATGASEAVTSVLYLSSDQEITSADTPLRSDAIPALAPDRSDTLMNVAAAIPADLAQGTYFVGPLVGSSGGLPEVSAANNAWPISIRVPCKRGLQVIVHELHFINTADDDEDLSFGVGFDLLRPDGSRAAGNGASRGDQYVEEPGKVGKGPANTFFGGLSASSPDVVCTVNFTVSVRTLDGDGFNWGGPHQQSFPEVRPGVYAFEGGNQGRWRLVFEVR